MLTQLMCLGLFLLLSLALYMCMMPLSFRPVARSGQHRLVQGSDCTPRQEKVEEDSKEEATLQG